MTQKKILDSHLEYKDKSMNELIAERNERHLVVQNELRRKWLPEKFNPELHTKNSH